MNLPKQIEEATNQFLCDAFKSKEKIIGVNWGDLDCVDVLVCKSLHMTEPLYIVEIEECSPDSNLREYISKKLLEKFPDIEFDVRTQW